MLKRIVFFFLSALYFQSVFSQHQLVYNPSIDVLHYTFDLQVSDSNNVLHGHVLITLKLLIKTNLVSLDLINQTENGKGMIVSSVKENNKAVSFTHEQNKLTLHLEKNANIGEIKQFEIVYSGIPKDGLIFSKNKFNNRTIFADNWPNRARNWIPCVDHLSDKASIDFIITAPDHYQVVANGIKVEETNLSEHLKLTHWKEEVPLPTKIMTIGIADFAVNYVAAVNGIPISSWVFPEDRTAGFYDYAQAAEILPFYLKNVGLFSYKKLANVQSKTIFGGLENASAIFYAENSITGKRGYTEELMAHEIAHQWFGDAVTETDWQHIWLSEGFATEMTTLYLENKYGKDTLIARLKKDRGNIIAFSRKRKTPVVDTTANENLMLLLNPNSYEKGGWVLHMLRRELGDAIFWKAIQKYYTTYRGKNASTKDLQQIFEKMSGKTLEPFFTQWLYTAGNPLLEINWSYHKKNKMISLSVTQQNEKIFTLPLEISITAENGTSFIKKLALTKKVTLIQFPVKNIPLKIEADPHCNLLFEGTVKQITE
jgi:aminopeptidase N